MEPLVSVIIASYNSSGFIIETLESIRNQTWKEKELIITDDCSKDNTIELCKAWLNDHKTDFRNTLLIEANENTGVPANVNRGLNASSGEWIKILGADDTLKTDCLEYNIREVSSNPVIRVLFSKVEVYRDTFEPGNLIRIIPGDPFNPEGIMSPGRDAVSQYKMLLVCDRIHYSPSVFIHKETLISVGGFDERYKILEDHPLWLNLTKNGIKLHFMDRVTVNYRQHSGAINNTGETQIINPNYLKSNEFRKVYTYPYLPADVRMDQIYTWKVSRIFRIKMFNKNTSFNRLLFSMLTIYLNPFRYFIRLKRWLRTDIKNNEFYK
jgi:alpha-1,3-rhamnosyltransferase